MSAGAKAKLLFDNGVIQSPSDPIWPEAEIVAKPVNNKILDEPQVLVRRRNHSMIDRHGWELMPQYELSHVSFFAGAGGFDIGFEQAGYHTLCQVEWDEKACATLIANRPEYFRHAALIQGDVRKMPTSMVLREAGVRVGECLCFTGGPPCQGYSTANINRRGGKYDLRNDLVFEYLRFIREGQPQFFIFENVSGFQSFTGKVDGKTYMERFLAEAYGSYYELVYGLVNACEYGVPQTRVRFICMGTRRDIADNTGSLASLPAPEYFSPDDLRTIELYQNSMLFPESQLLFQAPGIRYFPDRPVLLPPQPTIGTGRTQKFIEFYAKLLREEPDRVVTSKVATREPQLRMTVRDAIGDLPPIKAGETFRGEYNGRLYI